MSTEVISLLKKSYITNALDCNDDKLVTVVIIIIIIISHVMI